MTDTDRLFAALKIIGITTEPTETEGRLAWYAASGEYLGTHGIEDGLAYLKATSDYAQFLRTQG